MKRRTKLASPSLQIRSRGNLIPSLEFLATIAFAIDTPPLNFGCKVFERERENGARIILWKGRDWFSCFCIFHLFFCIMLAVENFWRYFLTSFGILWYLILVWKFLKERESWNNFGNLWKGRKFFFCIIFAVGNFWRYFLISFVVWKFLKERERKYLSCKSCRESWTL